MYVAHIDESGKGGPVFTVGGLSAKAEQWMIFSDQWQHVLDEAPSIPFFKYSDRQGLSEQAHHKKIDGLIEIINSLVARGDLGLIHVGQYKAFFRGKIGATFDNPFHQGYMHIITQCAIHLPDPNGKIDFVFDQIDDTQYLELLDAYRRFKEICPDPAVKRRFGQEPIRRDDKEVLPLQAADLWAGLMRHAYEGDRGAAAYLKKITVPNRCFVWDEEQLAELWGRSKARTPQLGLGF